jgi:hypothetical protein
MILQAAVVGQLCHYIAFHIIVVEERRKAAAALCYEENLEKKLKVTKMKVKEIE